MSSIRTSLVSTLDDPTLQKIAERVALEARLAIEKVAASSVNAEQYPLPPNEDSIEQILRSRFLALPVSAQEAAAQRAVEHIEAAPTQRVAIYADLADVDFGRDTSVSDQVQALAFPQALLLPADHPLMLFEPPQLAPIPAALMQRSMTRIQLRLHQVACVDETNPEGTNDEILMGGTRINEFGAVSRIDPFMVRRDFGDGKQEVYSPPRQFAAFDLSGATPFPKSFFVTIVLAEQDNGGFPAFLDKLLVWLSDAVSRAIGTAAGAWLGAKLGGKIGAVAGPIGAAIGAAVGATLGLIIGFLKDWWEDDVFAPAVLRMDIPSPDALWEGESTESPRIAIAYHGHGGIYQVEVDWQVFGPSILMPPAEPTVKGVIYAVQRAALEPTTGRTVGKHLLWFRHEGRDDGSMAWAPASGAQVGNGWAGFSSVFSAGDGVVYAIEESGLDPVTGRRTGGRLLWYRHAGWRDGAFDWAPNSGAIVASGWHDFSQTFAGDDGVVYAVRDNGDLLWMRHDGWHNGSAAWGNREGVKVGNGWGNFARIFPGDHGVIYAIEKRSLDPVTGRRTGGRLLWYRHDGRYDGSLTWAANSGAAVGRGWDSFSHVFSGGDGVIYAIRESGEMLWYRHEGRADGTIAWAQGSGEKPVGTGWQFLRVFAA
jgi:hypothetical protein